MASAILANIQEEVTCPICMELLKEPVSVDCGHTFCHACITLNYESSKDQEGKGSCPVCRVSYQFENLRPIRHVANIVEKLKGVKLSSAEEQTVYNCARHGEKLQLFCEKDEQVICWLCERSQEHRGHKTFLIEEVAQEYKEKLQVALQKLMKDKKKLEDWKRDLHEDRSFWQNQIQSKVQNVQEKFKLVRDILDSEEKIELQKLKREEEGILDILSESEKELVQQSKLTDDLISDLEGRLQESALEMLQNVNYNLERSETFKLQRPKTIPKELKSVFQAPDLRKVMKALRVLKEVRRYWVPVRLSQSNNPNIVITEDRRHIKYKYNDWRRCFPFNSNGAHDNVLGYPAITSGKCYWEVDVHRKDAWLLGINDGRCAKDMFLSEDELYFKDKSSPNVRQDINYQPKYGYWVIGMQSESTYIAFDESPATHKSKVLSLSLTGPLHRVGVFLDYEASTLSFYDVSNNGALIYRFCSCSFPKNVFPYFNLMDCPQPMAVCWPNT